MLWDTKTSTIVNNESADLIVMLAAWPDGTSSAASTGSVPAGRDSDLYPVALQAEIDRVNEQTYGINNGVYKCGFGHTQGAYDAASQELLGLMETFEALLGSDGREFLVGNRLTLADIRLFVTLVRMDEVYVIYFKCYFATLGAFPNLFAYTKRLLKIPAIAEATKMSDIKQHYFTSHAKLNAYAVIPRESAIYRKLLEA